MFASTFVTITFATIAFTTSPATTAAATAASTLSIDQCHEIACQMVESLHYLHAPTKPPIQVVRKACETFWQLRGNNCEYVISKMLDVYKDSGSNISETDIENAQNLANRHIRCWQLYKHYGRFKSVAK